MYIKNENNIILGTIDITMPEDRFMVVSEAMKKRLRKTEIPLSIHDVQSLCDPKGLLTVLSSYNCNLIVNRYYDNDGTNTAEPLEFVMLEMLRWLHNHDIEGKITLVLAYEEQLSDYRFLCMAYKNQESLVSLGE